MKRYKKLYVLLAVLVVACVVTFAVTRIEERQEAIKNSDEIILEVASDTVQSLSWTYDGQTLAFHRDEGWLYDDDEVFPVDEDKIADLLDQFQSFGVSFIIEDPDSLGQYGLDQPECTISLTTDSDSYEILLGSYSTMDSERYVSIGDGNVYLVSHDPLDDFDVELSDLILNDDTPDFDVVSSVQFTGVENYSFTWVDGGDSYREDDVYFVSQDGGTLPLDTDLADSYLQQITKLGLTDYVTYNVMDEELQAYGLDDPKLTVTVQYADEDGQAQEFVLYIGRDPAESDDDETVTAYARVGDSQIVYAITQSEYEALMDVSYDALRHQEVLPAELDDVTQIDVTLDGASYTITVENGDDGQIYYYDGQELDSADLVSALEGLTADSFTSETPTEKTEISLTLHLDLDGEPTVTIDLYRYDGSLCLAEVDGAPVSLVARSAVVDLIEAVNAIVL